MSIRAKAAAGSAIVLAASVVLSGCGLFGKGKESIDPPKEVSILKENEKLDVSDIETNAEAKETAATRDLYLVDKHGYVVSQSLPLPQTESVARQALEYLVSDGPVTGLLPNGFRTVIPAGTEVDVSVQKDGKAVVDFSEEFTAYNPADELKILQSITWTLTQFDSIDRVELQVNGYPLTEMPVNGTPISESGLSRADGINAEAVSAADITNTRPVTVYYLAQADDVPYYVPVTTRVTNKERDDAAAVVRQLASGPETDPALVSGFIGDVKLVDKPSIDENGMITLNFNEDFMENSASKMISEEALQSLVLSLTELPGIKGVSILVDGSEELVNEQGQPLTAPVMRPETVNRGSF